MKPRIDLTYVLCDVLAKASLKAFHFAAKAVILLVLRPQISNLAVELSNETIFLIVEIGSRFVVLQLDD